MNIKDDNQVKDMYDITVIGKPKPATRPMVLKNGITFSDRTKELKDWKRKIRKASRGIVIKEGCPLSCVIIFGMPIKDSKKWGTLHNAQPDFDNLAKAAVDAMQKDSKGPFQPIDNDGRIASSWILKIYSEKGFSRIIVKCLEDGSIESAWKSIGEAWTMPRGIKELSEILKK